jgi:WD40 repeat protein
MPGNSPLALIRTALPDLVPKAVMQVEKEGIVVFTGEQVHIAGKQWWTAPREGEVVKCLADVPWNYINYCTPEKIDRQRVYQADYRQLRNIARSSHYGIIAMHSGKDPLLQVLLGEDARRAIAGGATDLLSSAPGRSDRADKVQPLPIGSKSYSRDGRRFVVDGPGFASVWDVSTERRIYNTKAIRHVSGFLPDGTLLAAANDSSQSVIAWDIAHGTSRLISGGPLGTPVAISSDEKRLAASEDYRPQGNKIVRSERVLVWDLARQRVLLTIESPRCNPNAYRFSPDGMKLLGTDYGGNAFSWEIPGGRQSQDQ